MKLSESKRNQHDKVAKNRKCRQWVMIPWAEVWKFSSVARRLDWDHFEPAFNVHKELHETTKRNAMFCLAVNFSPGAGVFSRSYEAIEAQPKQS